MDAPTQAQAPSSGPSSGTATPNRAAKRVNWASDAATLQSDVNLHQHAVISLDQPHVFGPSREAPLSPFDDVHRVDRDANAEPPTSQSAETEDVHDQLDVYVDADETDGLPTSEDAQTTEERARQLLRAYSTGPTGILRSRRVKRKNQTHSEKPADEPEASAEDHGLSMGAGAGVLAALIALNQADENDIPSTSTSPAQSGTATPASLASPHASDDEDDEEERREFIAHLRAKKAKKQALYATPNAIASAGRHLASSAYHLATASAEKPFRRSQSATTLVSMSGDADRPPSPIAARSSSPSTLPRPRSSGSLTIRLASKPTSPINKTFSSSSLQHLAYSSTEPADESRTSPPTGRARLPKLDSKAKAVRRLAGQLGLEVGSDGEKSFVSPGLSRYAKSPASTSRKSLDSRRSVESSPALRAAAVYADSSPAKDRLSRHELGLADAETEAEAAEAIEDPDSLPFVLPSRRGRKAKAANLRINLNKHSSPPAAIGPGSWSPPLPRQMSPFRLDSPRKEYFGSKATETEEEWEERKWQEEKRRRRKAQERKMRQQVFITMHVAAVLARQEFILKLARAMMIFGAPTHRLEAQIQATARVLELQLQCIYLPAVMLVSFGDDTTHTSELKVIKQAQGLDLGKMRDTFRVYNKVVRDKMSVTDASVRLDELMVAPPKYKTWQQLIIGGLAGAFILPSAFYGSFIDCLVVIPLGSLLVATQILASRNDMYSSLFEIVVSTINAILAAALARSRQFCFASIASGSVVLILPGFIVLSGSLELANRQIVLGSLRLVYSILYSLSLGFGLSLGAEIYQRISGASIEGAYDFTCSALREDAPVVLSNDPAMVV